MLGLLRDVELLPSVCRVAVADETQLLEHIEGAVHGGWDGRGISGPAALDQLGTGEVTGGGGQHIDDRSALGGPAHASLPEALRHRLPWIGRSLHQAGGSGRI